MSTVKDGVIRRRPFVRRRRPSAYVGLRRRDSLRRRPRSWLPDLALYADGPDIWPSAYNQAVGVLWLSCSACVVPSAAPTSHDGIDAKSCGGQLGTVVQLGFGHGGGGAPAVVLPGGGCSQELKSHTCVIWTSVGRRGPARGCSGRGGVRLRRS